MSVIEELNSLRDNTLAAIAAADNTANLEKVRVAVLGKQGTLTAYLRSMGQLAKEDRAVVGKTVNEVRAIVEAALAERKAALSKAELEASMDEIGRAHV